MLTPRSLALAMGALRMNVIGVCVESEAGTLAGMALYDVVSRANHSCVLMRTSSLSPTIRKVPCLSTCCSADRKQ